MKAISLGWGVQSFTLAAMSALGELERVDVAIHADTTHERQATYEFAEKWTPWFMFHGVHVVTVKDVSTKEIWDGKMIPAFTTSEVHNVEYVYDEFDNLISWKPSGTMSKEHGQALRVCTQRWKVAPVRRYLQSRRHDEPVELWLGISTDEALRMKPSDVKYITHRWPLIEKGMSRNDCVSWLKAHDLEVPVKSSCVFCPYHDSKAWRELKMTGNGDWKKAIEVDRAIRKARPPYDLFIHPARIPLEEVDVRNLEDKGQLRLWDEECEGMCGL